MGLGLLVEGGSEREREEVGLVLTYIMILGVYVVKGLQVENTANVLTKCGHLL